MSDMGDYFREHRSMSKARRAMNRDNSAEILERAGVTFGKRNGGAHLIVMHEGKTVDFWPGTGKWLDRDGPGGRGVFKLLKHLGVSA